MSNPLPLHWLKSALHLLLLIPLPPTHIFLDSQQYIAQVLNYSFLKIITEKTSAISFEHHNQSPLRPLHQFEMDMYLAHSSCILMGNSWGNYWGNLWVTIRPNTGWKGPELTNVCVQAHLHVSSPFKEYISKQFPKINIIQKSAPPVPQWRLNF